MLRRFSIPLLVAALLTAVFAIPLILFAQGNAPLVRCGNAGQPSCGFADLLSLIARIVDFLIYALAVPIAALSFAAAGIMILTAGGNESQVARAKEIFWNVLLGLLIALSAWLVVKAIVFALVNQGYSYL